MSDKYAYLFGTCLIDIFYPQAGLDAISLLALCGYETEFPLAQTCCGQPPYNSGYPEEVKDIAAKTIALFSQHNYPLIVPSASCAGMIKYHYPGLFDPASTTGQQARNLAARTFELIDFIAEKLPYSRLDNTAIKQPIAVALHQSCSAQREMGVASQWLNVLDRLPNINVCLPARHTECCGFGGTFSVKSAAISATMTADKCQALNDTTAPCISSGDCGCLMNIETFQAHAGSQKEHTHLATLIARHFGVANES